MGIVSFEINEEFFGSHKARQRKGNLVPTFLQRLKMGSGP